MSDEDIERDIDWVRLHEAETLCDGVPLMLLDAVRDNVIEGDTLVVGVWVSLDDGETLPERVNDVVVDKENDSEAEIEVDTVAELLAVGVLLGVALAE